MTQDQENHLTRIKNETLQLLDAKYRRGQAEHGGNIWDINLLDNAIDEAIDLVVYLLTEKEARLRNQEAKVPF